MNTLQEVSTEDTSRATPYVLEVLYSRAEERFPTWRPYGGIFHVSSPAEAIEKAESRLADAEHHLGQWQDIEGWRVVQILATTVEEGGEL